MTDTAEQERTAKYAIGTGWAIRRHFRRTLKDIAWSLELKLDLEEDRSWFSSYFWIEVTGSDEALEKFAEWWHYLQERADAQS